MGRLAAVWLPFVVVAVVVRLGLSGQAAWQRRYDLDIYLNSARAFLASGSPYGYQTERGLGFTYPPVAVAPFVLLSRVPPSLSWTLLTVLTTVLVAGLCWLRFGTLHSGTASTVRLASAASLLALTEPFSNALWLGQLSPIVGVLSIVAITERRSLFASLAGLAAAVKLTPLTDVAAFMQQSDRVKRIGYALVGLLVFSLAGFVLAPAASRSYWTDLVWNTRNVGTLGSTSNVSLAGLLVHWGLSDALALPVALVLVAMTGLWLWIAWWRRGERPSVTSLVVATGALTVLAVPVSWSHHGLMICWGWAALLLKRRTGFALLGFAIWILPLFRWAGSTSGGWQLALQTVRPLSIVLALVLVARRAFEPRDPADHEES